MTNNESKRAWHRLGYSIIQGDGRFNVVLTGATKRSGTHQNSCGHGYRQQDQTHLTNLGHLVIGVH